MNSSSVRSAQLSSEGGRTSCDTDSLRDYNDSHDYSDQKSAVKDDTDSTKTNVGQDEIIYRLKRVHYEVRT